MAGQSRNNNLCINYNDNRTGGMWANYIDHMSYTSKATYKVNYQEDNKDKEKKEKKEEKRNEEEEEEEKRNEEEEKNDAKDSTSKTQLYKKGFTKKAQSTQLQNILKMQEESSAYCDEEKDDEAYGLLNKQYKLGAEVSFMPVLVNFYKILINTERADESPKVVDDLVFLIRDKLKSPSVECQVFGDVCRENKQQLKAILFYQIAGKSTFTETTTSKSIDVLQSCILGMKISIMKLLKHFSNHKSLVSSFYIPLMRMFTQQIHNLGGRKRKDICLIVVVCLHHVEICEGLVEDYDASEATLKHSIDLMESFFEEEASNYQLYGAALNNLGATYLRKRQPHEAIECLKKAIDANMNAQDYSSSEERGRDVERSMSVISQCEELIGDIELN